ncbi:hypothetical protein IJG71_01320 [Candidatus Saccharibacteria bacterium]|nr:hypothetical protein [Candidatus Saccharibacteria bacterium]
MVGFDYKTLKVMVMDEGYSFADFEAEFGYSEEEMRKVVLESTRRKDCAEKLVRLIEENGQDVAPQEDENFRNVEEASLSEEDMVRLQQLSELHQREQSALDSIVEAERLLKEACETRDQIDKDIDYSFCEVCRLESELKELRVLVAQSGKEYDRQNELIEDLRSQLQAGRKFLEVIRKELAELETVTVFIGADGSFSSSDSDFELDTMGHQDYVMKFIMMPLFDDARVREVNAFAKAICIVVNSAPRKVRFESEIPNFDSIYAELEDAFLE